MNQMEIFNNPEFGSIRVIEENGKYLFCGSDVAGALGYSNPRDALRRHCKGVVKRDTLTDGGLQQLSFLPEGDVYRLIVHSKMPSAERFERWVFDEVLPTIRKHGAYLTKEKLWEVATSPEALMKLCSDLLAEREANISLRKENAQLEGKAAFYDLFIDLKHSTNLRTTAKELDVPERRFIRFLLEKRFVYRTASGNVLPYANVKNAGLFCVKDYCNHGHTGALYAGHTQGQALLCPAAGDDFASLIRTGEEVNFMPEGKTIGQLMEEMRQKAGAQNYHGHDYMDLQRFAEDTRHMIIFDVLTHDSPVGWKGERTRLFLSDTGYENALDSQEKGQIKILSHAKVRNGDLFYDRSDQIR